MKLFPSITCIPLPFYSFLLCPPPAHPPFPSASLCTFLCFLLLIFVWLSFGRLYVNNGLLPIPLGIYTFSAVLECSRTFQIVFAVPKGHIFCWRSAGHSVLVSFSLSFTSLLTLPNALIIIATTFTVLMLQILSVLNFKEFYLFVCRLLCYRSWNQTGMMGR